MSTKPIIILFGSGSGPKRERYIGDRQNLGILLSPSTWRTPWAQWWACDNDAFVNRNDKGWWKREGETSWRRMLDKIDTASAATPPLFVLCPDVVYDWDRTLERYQRLRSEIVGRALPIAIALQDGAENDLGTVAALAPNWVFVGGSVVWKWKYADTICEYFHSCDIRVHVGRASGPRRVQECIRIGADSCDGTGWMRYADKMLPGLWRVLDGTNPQEVLGL